MTNKFFRKGAIDPQFNNRFNEQRRVESRLRRDMIEQIKGKLQPLECVLNSESTIFETSKLLKTLHKPTPPRTVKSVEQQLLEEIQFPQHGDQEVLGIGLYSYRALKRLCKNNKVAVQVPDTLIFGFGFKQPTLMFTDETGELKYKKGIEHFQFRKVMNIFKHLNDRENKGSLTAPLLIFKTDQGNYKRVILRRADALEEWRSREKQPIDCLMQRFILPKGRQTCKLRVISVPQGFKAVMLSNRVRFDGKVDLQSSPVRETVTRAEESLDIVQVIENPVFPTAGRTNIHAQAIHFQQVIEKRLGDSVQRMTAQTPSVSRSRSKSMSRPVSKLSLESQDDLGAYFRQDLSPVNLPNIPVSQLYALLAKEPHQEEKAEESVKPLPSFLVPVLRERFCTDSSDYKKTSACSVKSAGLVRPAVIQTKLLKELIDKVILKPKGLKLTNLVCDFCEDKAGTWWFIKIKAYQVESVNIAPLRNFEKVGFKCPGEYCNIPVPPDEHYSFIGRDNVKFLYNGEISELHQKHTKMLYELSKKTMLMDKILKSGDTAELGDLLNPRLLERVRVCYSCFHIYKDKEREFFNAELSQLKRSRKERWVKNETMKLLSDVNDTRNISGKPDAILKPRVYSAHSQTLLLLERRVPDTSQHMREMGKQVTSMLKEEREKNKSYFTLHQPAPAIPQKLLPAVRSESAFKVRFKDISRFSGPQIQDLSYQRETRGNGGDVL